jgi:2,3-bisphosphoglycerate-independent phosphoglycerate mutase
MGHSIAHMTQSPVVLIIRDGWGEAPSDAPEKFNAVRLAHTPCAKRLREAFPRCLLKTSGWDVGLPEGVMGNSEVGHQNIGAGRIVDQDRVRIDKACRNGQLAANPALQEACDRVRQNPGRKLHLIGLMSDSGVHSVLEHLFSIWKIAIERGVQSIVFHGFTDGRDAPAFSGKEFLAKVESFIEAQKVGRIGSLIGRFWAMDRDQRWERIEQAYRCLTDPAYPTTPTARIALENYYQKPLSETQKGDEFLLPTRMAGDPSDRIKSGDSVVCFNFRGDRPRELFHAFLDKDFTCFERPHIEDLYMVSLTEYKEGLTPNVMFHKPETMESILGEVIAKNGLKQFRCAETEKYPHVTFFFNDYREEPFPGEDRALIPSPRHIATYDQAPEMSAALVTEKVKAAILSREYALIVVNYANPDMVGHTGSLEAVIKACEAVDKGVETLLEAIDAVDGKAFITADHGNAECMWDEANQCPHTRHTLNPVEGILYGKNLPASAISHDR